MTEIDKAYQHFKDILKQHPGNVDWDLIKKAYRFTAHAHRDQRRQSGEPYVTHLIAVAAYLADLRLDSRAIAAGLLHDTLEDTEVTAKELDKEFGKDIRLMVEGVSKLKTIRFNKDLLYVENLRKMLIATAKDLRVMFIRLCDRLHNVQTLEYLESSEQQRIALETLEVYAPIADRLRLGHLRGPLEDYSFKVLQPQDYRWLYNITRKNYEERQHKLTAMSKLIDRMLTEEKIRVVEVQHRLKGIYSLYRKLKRHENDLSTIYDIVALRVIVPRISDCYAALGIIHREYKPLKGRIKDYIARPKANGYCSLHTTVQLKDGDIIEIQIRTPEMHEQAEYGLAAHWAYKGEPTSKQMQVSWVKELASLMKDVRSPKDLEHLKVDLFKHRIFALTPKGDVIDLPEEATPIDFAYHIHSDIGNQMIKARVNGVLAPLDTKLQSGDIVDIMTDKKKKSPDLKWLDSAKTALAKSKIKYYHRRQLTTWEKQLLPKQIRKTPTKRTK